ncbi:MAG TPA: hypothetical protein VMR21_12705 [Vicinamibacteria bacterium]|nr:hypothetical protein [Vicinamibacteria bacterium]
MSYEIDVASVRAVLLADGWHRVKGSSFGIGPIGYVAAPDGAAKAKKKANGDGQKKSTAASHVPEKLAPTLGARWTKPNGEVIACPVASVLALRHARKGKG